RGGAAGGSTQTRPVTLSVSFTTGGRSLPRPDGGYIAIDGSSWPALAVRAFAHLGRGPSERENVHMSYTRRISVADAASAGGRAAPYLELIVRAGSLPRHRSPDASRLRETSHS